MDCQMCGLKKPIACMRAPCCANIATPYVPHVHVGRASKTHMALKPCLHPGCAELSTTTWCEQHRLANQRTRDARRGPRSWYTGDWPTIRAAALKAQPWCTHCGSTADLTVDHITARTTADGVQVLCRSCNSSKGNR